MKFNYLIVFKLDDTDVVFTGVTEMTPRELISSCMLKLKNVPTEYCVIKFIYQPQNEDKNVSSSSSSPA